MDLILNIKIQKKKMGLLGPVAQSVSSQTNPGVVSLIPARSQTFVKIDHEIISMVIDSRKVVVMQLKAKEHETLVN